MPRYDFVCDECGCVAEQVIPSIPKVMPPAPKCLKCQSVMRRVFSGIGFSVKGYNSSNGFDKCHDGWKEKVSI
jgi:putative FmdB family regulatory protein